MGLVTEPDGLVKGCENLYVMDAAAFPRSVGVNPSATILAVAEYKIEKFIPANVPEQCEWEAKHHGWVEQWMEASRGLSRETLDPLNHPVIPVTSLTSQPVGVRFTEKLIGHCGRTREDRDRESHTRSWSRDRGSRMVPREPRRGCLIPTIRVSGTVTLISALPSAPAELSVIREESYIRLSEERVM